MSSPTNRPAAGTALETDTEDWHARWRDNRIGFHQPDVNRLLMKFWPDIVPSPAGDVFVPLCGKSHDMTWLAERGHHVIGVELSDVAARAYFDERGITPTQTTPDDFNVLTGGGVEIWCGDYFAFPPERLAQTVGAFDRASLIALPPAVRARYAARMATLIPAGTQMLLLTIAYDQSEASGPPFSVPDTEVDALFAAAFEVTHLGIKDATAVSGNLTSKGVTAVTSSAFTLRAKKTTSAASTSGAAAAGQA
ncbi:MAG: thiopurine S-methyltransferase [Pseudomonadota bacterium]